MIIDTDSPLFTLRRDRRGFRPVYNLGNEFGDCPYRCTFCSVGRSPKVTPESNLYEFERQHREFLKIIDGPYHPLIYNQGNVTNSVEFSRTTLIHIVDVFSRDPRVAYVSLNSRERNATDSLLEELEDLRLPFPIHFIFGIESFSSKALPIFGKDSRGELERFIRKLERFNVVSRGGPAEYTFGLDLNLVFLPEMYLEDGEGRAGNDEKIADGFRGELRTLLSNIVPTVPVEINLHPYHRVDTLPYEHLDLGFFMNVLVTMHEMVEAHNQTMPECATSLFVGVEGTGFDSEEYSASQKRPWKSYIEGFNRTARVEWSPAR